jgi:hypothetical protein
VRPLIRPRDAKPPNASGASGPHDLPTIAAWHDSVAFIGQFRPNQIAGHLADVPTLGALFRCARVESVVGRLAAAISALTA